MAELDVYIGKLLGLTIVTQMGAKEVSIFRKGDGCAE